MKPDRHRIAAIVWGSAIVCAYLTAQRLAFHLNEGIADVLTLCMPLAALSSAFAYSRGLRGQHRPWLTGILVGFAVGTLLKEANWLSILHLIYELPLEAKRVNIGHYGPLYGLIAIVTVMLSCAGGLGGALLRKKSHPAAQEN